MKTPKKSFSKKTATSRVRSRKKEIFRHDYDNAGMGASGSTRVFQTGTTYVVVTEEFEDLPSDPYPSLDEALHNSELLVVTSASSAIQSSVLSAGEIAARLCLSISEDEEWERFIKINGEVWVWSEASGFEKQ